MLRALAGRIGRALIAWDRAGGPEAGLLREAATLTPMACPCCGSRAVGRIDEESVRCKACGCETDAYEAMKAAEP